jgi:hypothetical protein
MSHLIRDITGAVGDKGDFHTIGFRINGFGFGVEFNRWIDITVNLQYSYLKQLRL